MNLKDYRLKHFSDNWGPHAKVITKLIEEVGNKKPSNRLLQECMLTHSNEALAYQDDYFNSPYRYLALLRFLRETPKIEAVESITIQNKKGDRVVIQTRAIIEAMAGQLFDSFNGSGYDRDAYDAEIIALEKTLPAYKTRKPEKAFFIRYCKRRCKEIHKAVLNEYPHLELTDMCILIGKILYTRGLRFNTYGDKYYNPFAFESGGERKNFIKLIKYYLN